MGMISRIRERRRAREPRQQFYGGSEEAADAHRAMYAEGRRRGESQIDEGVANVNRERIIAGQRSHTLSQEAETEAGVQRRDAVASRAGADQSLADYRSGRAAQLGSAGAIDSNASAMEAIARNAPGQYQSAADAAFAASTERNQRNALSLAAGRGAGGLRTALAASTAANQSAAVDQQATRAAEMNQLLGLQTQAYQGAAGVRGQGAGVRSALSAQDQQAAQIQAQRQQAATGAGQASLQQRGALAAQDATIGANAAGTMLNSATGTRDAYLGGQQALEVAQLGGNQAYELQRQQAAANNSPFQRAFSGLFDQGNLRGAQGGNFG